MIFIKYEMYQNDYIRWTNLTKSFDSLDDFGKWLMEYATPYRQGKERHLSDSYLHVWYENLYKMDKTIPSRLESRNYDENRDIWVYLVQNEDGIIYSGGKYTGGVDHVSKDMMLFLRNLQHKYEHPEYTFVD